MAFGIPNIERAVSNFIEGGTGITSIRSVDWDKNFLWAIEFPFFHPEKPPFDKLFPAASVTIPMGIVNTESIMGGQNSINFPVSSSAKELSVTFYDNEKRDLLQWFRDWIELDIQNKGQFVSGLEDYHTTVVPDYTGKKRRVMPVRDMRLMLLSSYQKEVLVFNYGVFPTGQIDFSGSQSSEATQYTIQFGIASDQNQKPVSKEEKFGFDDVKGLLGRLI